MKQGDIDAMMRGLIPAVREHIAKSSADMESRIVAPLLVRISDLEKALAEKPQAVGASEVAKLVMETISPRLNEIEKAVSDMPEAPKLPDIPALVDAAVAVSMLDVPVPKDGKDANPEEVSEVVLSKLDIGGAVDAAIQEVSKDFTTRLDGVVRKDDLPDFPAMIAEEVAKIPAPQDGESVSVDDVLPELKVHLAELVAALPPAEKGADGVGLAGAFIDRNGELTVTLTNGETRGLGPVVGNDGEPGIGFDDMDIVHDGEREFTFRFQRGAKIVERSFSLPVMLDRGVFTDGKGYVAGDVVSYGGSMWIAQKETDERPGTGDGWRLSVKKGRNGKDGEMKGPVEQGPVKVG